MNVLDTLGYLDTLADNKTRRDVVNISIMQEIAPGYENPFPFKVGRRSYFETERCLEFLQLCSTLDLQKELIVQRYLLFGTLGGLEEAYSQ